MWSVVRFSDDSDGSVILIWVEQFSDFKEALQFLAEKLDSEESIIIDCCNAALQSDLELTAADIGDLYAISEWIGIQEGKLDMCSVKTATVILRATVVRDGEKFSVMWLPKK